MKNKFSLELVDMFDYYCDIKKDYSNCKLILMLLSYINEDYEDYEYYMKKINNQRRLMDIVQKLILDIEKLEG